jgi:hypothetical protein
MAVSRLRTLLNANVHVLGLMTDSGQVALQNGRALFGTSAVPLFTSEQLLLDSVNAGQQCLVMPGKTFFNLAAGQSVVLNPTSPDSQEFSAAQVLEALNPPVLQDAPVTQTKPSLLRSLFGLQK